MRALRISYVDATRVDFARIIYLDVESINTTRGLKAALFQLQQYPKNALKFIYVFPH